MKRTILRLCALFVGYTLILAGRVPAQTLTNLHTFTGGSDGGLPQAGLILSGNTLYGTANSGGNSGYGTVFKVNTDGTGFTNLHSFTALLPPSKFTNSDGANPDAGLILSDNNLFGTVRKGGRSGGGTVFAVHTDGMGFTNLHSFAAALGPYPHTNYDGTGPGGLILSGNTIYGTASGGGSSGHGTVFAVNTDGTGFTILHSFTATSGTLSTNSDGAYPYAGLILAGNTLYGTAAYGGSSGDGTLYAVHTDGRGFTNLHSFIGINDGALPHAGLALSGDTLYGTAYIGGRSGAGTMFAAHTDGTGFTNLHSFLGTTGDPSGTNSDGAAPLAGLVLSGNTLFGVAYSGGSWGAGMVFFIHTDGTSFRNLYSFSETSGDPYYTNKEGAYPLAGLILSGNALYGTTQGGGGAGKGTVFSLSLPLPQLTIIRSRANLILTWPTDAAGFTLQSAPAIAGRFTNIPAATSPYTNGIAGRQQFFRLISN